MRTASNVFQFRPTTRKLRSAKAVLRSDIRAGVRQIIALAPVLGRCSPSGVPTVVEVMKNLIDPPDPNEFEHEEPARAVAVRPTARATKDACAVVESVATQIALLDQLLADRRRTDN